jgi:hypothetical protein
MFDTSYRLILFSLLSMVIAGGLLFYNTATIVAYILLVTGFFGIGIGILIGFFKMINESD